MTNLRLSAHILLLGALLTAALSVFADTEQGYEYVDLGLPSATMWATMNIGAELPEEGGEYFAWGEIAPKDNYTWATYRWMTPGESTAEYINKYTIPDKQYTCCWYSPSGEFIGDGLYTLLPEDDAASVCWGGRWRMPTDAEWVELLALSDTTLTYHGDVFGLEVVGSNGNQIFLPAAGYKTGKASAQQYNRGGFYYSSSHHAGRTNSAYRLNFGPVEVTSHYGWGANRYIARTIRPVMTVIEDVTTSLSAEVSTPTPVTVIHNGALYILIGNRCYNAQGALLPRR